MATTAALLNDPVAAAAAAAAAADSTPEVPPVLPENVANVANVANKTLMEVPSETRETRNLCACILTPLYDLVWKPIVSKITSIFTSIINCLCCNSTETAAKNVTIHKGVTLTPQQKFAEKEKERFADRAEYEKAGVTPEPKIIGKLVGRLAGRKAATYTLSATDGTIMEKCILWDKTYVGGDVAAESPDAIAERIKRIDAKDAHASFYKLHENVINAVVVFVQEANNPEDAENFINTLKNDLDVFKDNLGLIRDGMAQFFHTKAEAIRAHRAIAHNVPPAAAAADTEAPEED